MKKTKIFTLWLARRGSCGPDFEYKEVAATSQKEARRVGKSLEHPADGVWFRGLVSNRGAA